MDYKVNAALKSRQQRIVGRHVNDPFLVPIQSVNLWLFIIFYSWYIYMACILHRRPIEDAFRFFPV